MRAVQSVEDLEAVYGTPAAASLRKVATRVTPDYAAWIARSRFCVLSTVGPEGTDGSPRGDAGPVAHILDETRLALPDRRGNNRMDSLRNIVEDPRVSLMFMVPGANMVVRVNGTAIVTLDPETCDRFVVKGQAPRSVVVVTVGEIYFQCARALMRSGLWSGEDQSEGLPTAGQILAGLTDGAVGGASYDAQWPERAAKTMW